MKVNYRHSLGFRNLAFLVTAFGGIVGGQIVSQAEPVKTHKSEFTPDQKAYNDAVGNFNKATQAYNSAKNAGQPLSDADAMIVKNIAELQQVLQLPSYQSDTKMQATLHNLIGYLYLTQNNSAAAIPELQSTVQLAPDNLDARNNLGNALRQNGRYADAAVQYQYVLDHLTPGQSGLDPARIKQNLAASLGQAGKTDEALTLYGQAVADHPDADTYRNYGFYLQKAGRNAEAADAFEKAAERDPKNAETWFSAGVLYAKAQRTDDAIAALTRAVGPDLDPKLTPSEQYSALFTLGEAHASKGDANQAIKDFDAASALQPTNAVPVYNKGVMQEQAGLKSEAEASYRQAQQNDAGNGQIQMALGLLLADEGKNAEAITELSSVLPKLPQDAKAAPLYARLGDLYAKQNEMGNANAARRQAVALNPSDTDTHLALAASYQAQKQYVPALAQYDAAAIQRPNDANIQNQRGVIYKNLKQYPKALKAFQQSFALDPTNGQVMNNIGVLYELLGSKAKAVVAYKKALTLNPYLTIPRQNLNRFTRK